MWRNPWVNLSTKQNCIKRSLNRGDVDSVAYIGTSLEIQDFCRINTKCVHTYTYICVCILLHCCQGRFGFESKMLHLQELISAVSDNCILAAQAPVMFCFVLLFFFKAQTAAIFLRSRKTRARWLIASLALLNANTASQIWLIHLISSSNNRK